MLIHLAEDEQVLRLEQAGLAGGGRRARGALCLTTARLIWKPLGAPDDDPGQSMLLAGVGAVRPARLLGLLRVGVDLELADGGRLRLLVADVEGWVRDIEAARRGEAVAPADLAGLMGRPIDPVVSWPAVLAWVIAPLAFVPVLGVLPAIGLLACGLVLGLGRKRDRDRSAGLAFTILAGLALVLGGLGLACLVTHGGAPELPANLESRASLPTKVAQVLVLVFSVVLHECGHGLSALWAGDTTALRAGRLTLNPLRHVDLFGSVVLPAILIISPAPAVFGWAKPVPVSPAAFRRRKLGNVAVSLAGVSANLLIAMACLSVLVALGAALRFLCPEAATSGFWIPIAPTRISGAPGAEVLAFVGDLLKTGVLINLVLMGFNLLPVPPLDGSHVLETVLPGAVARHFAKLRAFGFVIVAALIFTGALDRVFGLFVSAAALLLYSAGVVCGLG